MEQAKNLDNLSEKKQPKQPTKAQIEFRKYLESAAKLEAKLNKIKQG